MSESRDKVVESIENDAYSLRCKCPNCGSTVRRGFEEEMKYCEKCGQKLHLRAFTKEEVDSALFEHEMDEYEDL